MLSYKIDRSLLPRELQDKVLEYSFDSETRGFLDQISNRPMPWWKPHLFSFLSQFIDVYDVHALLGMYNMWLLSNKQWRDLAGGQRRSLLDVGAGQGFVTKNAKEVFDTVYVNELYPSMRKRLKKRDFSIVDGNLEESIQDIEQKFDVVSIFNVIDRCERPISLIRSCTELLNNEGRLIIADPLPFNPKVLRHGHSSKPIEALSATEAASWEESLVRFYTDVIKVNNLEVICLTRLPYLSQSINKSKDYVMFDDMVIVCRKAS